MSETGAELSVGRRWIRAEAEQLVAEFEAIGEALTGERTGQVLSREIHSLPRRRQGFRDVDAVSIGGRQQRARLLCRRAKHWRGAATFRYT